MLDYFKKAILPSIFALSFATVPAKPSYPPKMPDAREFTYKEASQTELKLWVFQSEKQTKGGKRPAIVFFFGGGWKGGTPAQFEKQCQ